jgi:phosphoribosyl 1,2-cyclic phosphodiesterase
MKPQAMKIKVLGSSSAGNCYIIGNDTDAILLECGLPFKEIQRGADFKLNRIKACVMSHNHGDHSKGFKGVLQSGIPLYCSEGTAKAINLTPERFRAIGHGHTVHVNGWRVSSFDVDHDVPEPLGFIIEHPEAGKILFITDTYILKWDFSVDYFDVIMIEANYCEDIAKQIREKRGDDFVNKRRLNQHMSFQTAIKTLEKLTIKPTCQIVLIHLSDGMTDAKRFVKETQEKFGVSTVCAAPGVEINLTGY